jgi:hypothetical protein
MASPGVHSRALFAIARDDGDDRALAGSICRACVVALGVDGAAVGSLYRRGD